MTGLPHDIISLPENFVNLQKQETIIYFQIHTEAISILYGLLRGVLEEANSAIGFVISDLMKMHYDTRTTISCPVIKAFRGLLT